MLSEDNAHQRLPIASTTKVMTAIIAIENAPLDKVVTIPKEAVGVEGSSIYLVEGEQLTMEELLYGLMLASGNDAATAIAIAVGGSIDGFTELMNKKAIELGAKDTHFTNPHGLQDKEHYASAADLAKICAYAMKNPVFALIAGTTQKTISKDSQPNGRFLNNKNKMLSIMDGGNGIKIGFTKVAGRCLCASAKRGDMQLICVVLNDGNWFNDAKDLMENAFSEYTMQTIVAKGQLCGNINVEKGKVDVIDGVAQDTFMYPVKKGETPYTTSRLIYSLKAPIQQGTNLGEIKLYLNESQIGTMPIIAAQGAESNKPPTLLEKIRRLFE